MMGHGESSWRRQRPQDKELRMRILVYLLIFLGGLLSAAVPVHAQDSLQGASSDRRPVAIDIMVVRAFRKPGPMDARLKKQVHLTKQIRNAGFRSAKVSDALKTTVEVGSSVGVEVLASPKPRLLKVRVNEVTADKRIKLTVGIKAFEFEIDTEHKNGGMIVVAHPQGPDAALFLAVTPKL